MKKIYILLLAAGMMFATSQEAISCPRGSGIFSIFRTVEEPANNPGDNGNGGAVGAPLDGGLLAILAAAGGAYFVARRKKKKQQ